VQILIEKFITITTGAVVLREICGHKPVCSYKKFYLKSPNYLASSKEGG
jgi:hypothetical protein